MTGSAKRLLIAGGGTGGHIYIGIAIAREFMSRSAGREVLFVGTQRGLDSTLIPRTGFPIEYIDAAALKGIRWRHRIRNLLALPRSLVQSRQILRRFRPQVVVGVGGYSSGPVALVAEITGVPVLLVEPNAVPGFTNRVLGRWADQVAVHFKAAAASFGDKAVRTGIPVRPEFFSLIPKRRSAMLSVLIFGGSQGSHIINEAMCAALPFLKSLGGKLRIHHQSGARELESVRRRYREAGIAAELESFIQQMPAAFSEADVVVCRAGASTVAEIAAARKASILIPFGAAADDHQRKNALELAQAGAAVLLEEKDLSGETLAARIRDLAETPGKIEAMETAAGQYSRPHAARQIVDLIERMG